MKVLAEEASDVETDETVNADGNQYDSDTEYFSEIDEFGHRIFLRDRRLRDRRQGGGAGTKLQEADHQYVLVS